MTGRWAVTLLALAGALTAGFSAHTAGSGVASLGWALAAGLGLSLMLRGLQLRFLGVALSALAVAAAGWAGQAGEWVSLTGMAVSALALLGMVWWGPGWVTRRRAEHALDMWAAMDSGVDPTDEQDVPRAGEAR